MAFSAALFSSEGPLSEADCITNKRGLECSMVSVSLENITDHDEFTRGDAGTGIWMISTKIRCTVCGQAHVVGRLWRGRACWGRHEKQGEESVRVSWMVGER